MAAPAQTTNGVPPEGAAVLGALRVAIAGEAVDLIPQRAAYWVGGGTLLIADAHLGKVETFAAHGVPLPEGLLEAQLVRLSGAVEATKARRILVLGDLLHAEAGLTERMIEEVGAWRRGFAGEVWVVPGNHDRRLDVVRERWGLTVLGVSHEEGPFVFMHEPHEPGEAEGRVVWCGHVHPVFRLRSASDSIRLPCFVVGKGRVILPAFNDFTGGASVRPGPGDAVYAVADGDVVQVH